MNKRLLSIFLILFTINLFAVENTQNNLIKLIKKGDVKEVIDQLKKTDIRKLSDNEQITILIEALKNKKFEIAKQLFKYGFNVDAKRKSNSGGYNTLLNEVCIFGQVEYVKFFINNGADINHLDEKGFTPLMNASLNGFLINPNHDNDYLEIVMLLLKKGADVNYSSKYLATALTASMIGKNFDIFSILIAYGANLNPTEKELPPLLKAIEINEFKTVKYLVDKGARVDVFIKYSHEKKKESYIDIAHEKEEYDIEKFLKNQIEQIGVNDKKNWITYYLIGGRR